MQKRPCWVEISTSAFEHNYKLLSQAAADRNPSAATAKAAPSVGLLAIVKADAYGHGLSICGPAAVRAGASWIGVTSVEEGVAARQLCPTAEILVISGPFPGQGKLIVDHRLVPVVWDQWHLDELESAGRRLSCGEGSIPVHLEVDTGMNRQGIGVDRLPDFLSALQASSTLRLQGVMTHLYAADESDHVSTLQQFTKLREVLEQVEASGKPADLLHVGNSAALLGRVAKQELLALCLRFDMRPMMRPGLALYGLAPGYSPSEPEGLAALRNELRPVLTWKTQVVTVHSLTAGQTVGYNGTFVASEPMSVALLAVGYADGFKRALSNRGYVLVRGQRAPIVGRISMDQTVVDITGISEVVAGDEVVLLGVQGHQRILAEDQAAWANTVPWEIFTSIAARVERRSL